MHFEALDTLNSSIKNILHMSLRIKPLEKFKLNLPHTLTDREYSVMDKGKCHSQKITGHFP